MHGLAKGTIATLLVALALVGCKQPAEPSTGDAVMEEPTTTGDSTKDPGWIYQDPNKRHPVAVVFVHGLFGDVRESWSNGNKSFFDYLHESGIGDKVDIYAFGFTSSMIGQGSLKVGQAAIKLDQFMKIDGVDKYDQIVFVAHSMGGLITMRELISNPALRAKVPLVVLYATPQDGAELAKLGAYAAANNLAVRQMKPADDNDYLEQLQEDWVNVRNTPRHPEVICAYETKDLPILGRVVPKSSGTRFCDQNAAAIENSDHLSIVKPDRPKHPSVVALLTALNDFAMPALSDASWETKKFDTATDPWSYDIKDAGGRNTVTFANHAQIPMQYSIRSQDAGLLADPNVMPRLAQPDGNEAVDLILLNPLKKEYTLEVRLGMAPPRTVIARIADMDQAIAQRNALEAGAAQHMSGYLATGDNQAAFKLLTPEQQQEKFLTLASESIAERQPGLPESARLVLAADTLATLGLSDAAAHTLSTVEAKYPDVAKTAGVRHLAGVVSARTGRTDVLEHAEVPVVPAEEALKPADFSRATEVQRRDLSVLADQLRTNPATEAEGFVLKGDVAKASGDQAAAMRAYTEAQTVDTTPKPVVRARMRAATDVDH
ncbi:esterase/lipase family protein [Noviluteimonas gilva]|uniref:AB hydrolase-1 domain-containing protein n=1 Tax=Noviluteimonas gilva TaxID=2682097 RepID=A0A7C9HKM3_9GAMM|nr:alpha/beta fold hydrolase [Lysobacter gilvus]MUV12936.1 hypothetical protein [Lysobacter gilvus]